jgi:hypothetical protein
MTREDDYSATVCLQHKDNCRPPSLLDKILLPLGIILVCDLFLYYYQQWVTLLSATMLLLCYTVYQYRTRMSRSTSLVVPLPNSDWHQYWIVASLKWESINEQETLIATIKEEYNADFISLFVGVLSTLIFCLSPNFESSTDTSTINTSKPADPILLTFTISGIERFAEFLSYIFPLCCYLRHTFDILSSGMAYRTLTSTYNFYA